MRIKAGALESEAPEILGMSEKSDALRRGLEGCASRRNLSHRGHPQGSPA
jgi:hypothetical protein